MKEAMPHQWGAPREKLPTRAVWGVSFVREGMHGPELLLVHNRRSGLWYFPGGKQEEGEQPLAGLVRELHEELGASFTEEEIRTAAHVMETGYYRDLLPEGLQKDYIISNFLITDPTLLARLANPTPQEGDGIDKVQWVPLAALQDEEWKRQLTQHAQRIAAKLHAAFAAQKQAA